MQKKYKAAIFDLDGVIVDTAKFHYLAWKRVAKELGFKFSEKNNEFLKGVSREKSLEILLEIGNISIKANERKSFLVDKNRWYMEYVSSLDGNQILPGALDCIEKFKAANIKIALGSASKNTPLITERLGVSNLFDAIVDGNCVQKAKPDPQCFAQCARRLKVEFCDCVVFEDSEASLKAAKHIGMYAIGIGNAANFQIADTVITGLDMFGTVQYLFDI